MSITRRGFMALGGLGLMLPLVRPSALLASTTQGARREPRHIIVDTDPGVDDAVAILLAFQSREVIVDAMTVVAGNVDAATGSRNARILLELVGRTEIPAAMGAVRPLQREALTARIYHGSNGLGELQFPNPKIQLDKLHGADLIVQHVKANPGNVEIVALGPLTNVAIALTKDPSIARQIAGVTFMGGTILSNGNVTPVATFNMYADPEAARIVVNSGIPKVVMVGTDVTTKVQFTAADLDELDGNPLGHMAAELGRFRLRRFHRANTPGGTAASVGFNDLPAMAAAIRGDLFTMEKMNVDIETKGELTAGMTVANRRNRVVRLEPEGDHMGIVGDRAVAPNVAVCMAIDQQGVKDLFLQRLKG